MDLDAFERALREPAARPPPPARRPHGRGLDIEDDDEPGRRLPRLAALFT